MLPPAAPARPSNSNGLVVLALVLGLVLGATAVGMIWFVSGRSASATEIPPTNAAADAMAACASLARVPATIDRSAKDRLAGAAALAMAAQAADRRYTVLADALHQADLSAGRQQESALNAARTACAEW
ncbi:MAG TPA: hypothetical protein VFX16_34350 [Pseudonocardiaceae bacterium]|nr:hypothetical protein [Pseudonocardiaceae bacterium]